eukprot:CAMPEP_0198138112 /NCGR_PEP_ID=MMETSP1443-20131203/1535_1 /TAXON_ID=186043 /ORGANISM="Entomoneis sp., Strain CCMP2396" /LENGTH=216 /DNA_ID=CAMNT_0043799755 /DNA_START=82 /DNA_END=732 /DNA_ORIENTATION=+
MILEESSVSTNYDLSVGENIKESMVSANKRTDNAVFRKVNFVESSNEYHSNRDIQLQGEGDESTSTWYSDAEYDNFRRTRRSQLKQISKEAMNDSFSDLFEAVYDKAQEVADGEGDVADIFSSDQMQQLSHIFKRTEHLDLIGLERYVTPFGKLEAINRKKSMHYVVEDIQDEVDHELWTVDEMGDELRESCANLSQTDCIVARIMAKAKAKASTL